MMVLVEKRRCAFPRTGASAPPSRSGREGSRLDDSDLDAERSDLLRQRFRQSYDAELGCEPARDPSADRRTNCPTTMC